MLKVLRPLSILVVGSIAALVILWLAYIGQNMSVGLFAFTVVALGAVMLYFLVAGLSVMSVLGLSPILFIRPIFFLNICYLLLLVLVFTYEQIVRKKVFDFNIHYFPTFLILLAAGLRSFFLGVRGDGAFMFLMNECITPIIVFTIIMNTSLSLDKFKMILKGHFTIALILGIAGIAIAVTHPGDRIGSLWTTAMTINGYYVINLFTGIALMLEEQSSNKRMYYLVALFLVFLGMVFTYTKIVLIGVAFGLFLMALKKPRLFRYLIPLMLVIPFILPGAMVERLVDAKSGDGSSVIRMVAWFYSILLIKDHFFLGNGIDSFSVLYDSYMEWDFLYARHSHNIYLRILVEMGIVGFIGFFTPIVSIIKKCYLRVREIKDISFEYMLFVAIAVEMVFGLTDVFIAHFTVGLYFWMLLALTYNYLLHNGKPIEDTE